MSPKINKKFSQMDDKEQVAGLLLQLHLIQKRDSNRTPENQQLTSRIRGEIRHACKVLQQVLDGQPKFET